MARRRTSPLEDLAETAAILPWWVGCVLAVVSFLIFHAYANAEILKPDGARQMGVFVVESLFANLARVLQYLVPGAFCIGSIVSLFNGARRKTLFNGVKANHSPDVLFDMTWREFEMVVGESFRRRGYQVKETGGNGPDGGVDLILTKGDEKYLVQCKQWKAFKVGVQPVRELYGVMAAMGAAGGYVITAGEYTRDARAFVTGLSIQLIDGAGLHRMIKDVRQDAPIIQASPQVSESPICPKCSESMVRRTARQGSNAGNEFWGCAKYPACRGVRPA
jgi:restriction system protein